MTERWLSRFLVPKEVRDGVYEVQVWIVRADGTLEHATVPYTIDSEAQPLTLDVSPVPGGLLLRVFSDEERILEQLVNVPDDKGDQSFGHAELCP